jgi:hypothetical protein
MSLTPWARGVLALLWAGTIPVGATALLGTPPAARRPPPGRRTPRSSPTSPASWPDT